jgi:hypothetical protein
LTEGEAGSKGEGEGEKRRKRGGGRSKKREKRGEGEERGRKEKGSRFEGSTCLPKIKDKNSWLKEG